MTNQIRQKHPSLAVLCWAGLMNLIFFLNILSPSNAHARTTSRKLEGTIVCIHPAERALKVERSGETPLLVYWTERTLSYSRDGRDTDPAELAVGDKVEGYYKAPLFSERSLSRLRVMK
jgi:hypothetical protein